VRVRAAGGGVLEGVRTAGGGGGGGGSPHGGGNVSRLFVSPVHRTQSVCIIGLRYADKAPLHYGQRAQTLQAKSKPKS